MKNFGVISTAAAVFAGAAYAAVDPIVIKGSKFFYQTNGTQFFIRGVAYQQDYNGNGSAATSGGNNAYVDPLADASGCKRDIPYLTQLGTNVIRTYAIDPTQDHSECMNMLADAGIYVISDLSAPGSSINRDSPSWDDSLYQRYTNVIDSLANYTNTLGFFAGNEVANAINNTNTVPFVKAAIRDMKAYIKQKNYRAIGVGYATNDDADIRVNLADYFDCGSNSADALDFWGYNIYSWCGNSSYTESGYDQRTAEFQSYNVPVFFAEYGCNTPSPRDFTEVQALFGSQMSPVWSGGIVYEYFQEANDFGLVSVDGTSVSTLVDFENLSSQIAMISPSGVNSGSYSPTNTAPQSCPTEGSDWAAATALPPTPNSELCQCMYQALTCIPSTQVTDDNVGDLFGVLCGLDPSACVGIAANGSSGDYGAYGMCNPTQQIGWALNAYYTAQVSSGNGASACAFSGSATTQSVVTPTGTCASLIQQAGAQGTGTVTSKPTATGGSTTGGSGSSSSSKGAAPAGASTLASANFGYFSMGAYVLTAFLSGAGMILL